jgi:thermolysin
MPGRKFVRLDQYYRGVLVWGGEVVREVDDQSVTQTVLTNLYVGINILVEPLLTAETAKSAIERLGGAKLGPDRQPRLVVFPLADGSYRLSYTERVASLTDVRRFFLDARTGDLVADFSEALKQSAIGSGTGVLGDTKKISTTLTGGVYVTEDAMRPPALYTLDLRGNPWTYVYWINGTRTLYTSDLAADSDNTWTDAANVDAHVHSGWAYDYFFKRFGRRGLDDNDSTIKNMVHPVKRSDLLYYISIGLYDDFASFYANAFYVIGKGTLVFGEGLPTGLTIGGRYYNYLAGGLDIVAHEYTHGVSDYSSHLASTGDPRSLSEAFSDMMATAVEYSFRPNRANYVIGEDVVTGGLRSLSDPGAYGGVDHYSKRGPSVGYEYPNSTIASHAFYLAIEGGTNRTSKLAVQGVGSGNREQVEKAFYRGFTSLTSQATFGQARARTVESARVLYGAGSAAERAVTQAWDAVGVF